MSTAKELYIYTEPTPNPQTLKFMIGQEISKQTYDFTSVEEARNKSELVESLFSVADITGIYVGRTFLTVSKSGLKHWDDYEDSLLKLIEDYIKSGKPVVVETESSKKESKELTEVEKQIVAILDDEIRPAVAMDGGDVIFKSYEDGIVYLQMIGSCAGCPSSTATLKMGIETRIREAIPTVTEVVAV
ncbi:MAG: NifU family protein [Candidatus Cloacimonetes bacterium]|nr:NifU family protein [Candidatus Cloacimonadota bacterium]